MRFMVLVKSDESTEAGALPTTEELAEMGAYNEQLVEAGMLLSGEGLQPSSKGARIAYSGVKASVTDGPFPEAKELVAGYWVIQAKSLQEAVDWLKRAPFKQGEVEIRQVFEAEDFGEAFTPELQEQERRLRARASEHKQ